MASKLGTERKIREVWSRMNIAVLDRVQFERETSDVAILLDSGVIAWITNYGIDYEPYTGDPLIDCVEFEAVIA